MARLYDATVERITDVAPETRSFVLRLAGGQRLRFAPGQFISLQLSIDAAAHVRPYSIASDPEESDVLEICLNRVPGGTASEYLFGLKVGAVLHFTGPWGTFVLDQPPDVDCIFIGEGTGVVPLRPMVRRALTAPSAGVRRLIHAAPGSEHLLYQSDFLALTGEHPAFVYTPLLAEADSARQAALVDLIRHDFVEADTHRRRHFFICAVGDIVYRLRDLLRASGYERRAVQYEKW